MLKNDYRRALIMLRPIRQGLSGHVRLERRTLMGSMQFTVNGVASGSELHAALIGHPGGRYVGAKLGAFGGDRYGQVGLTVKFDPRNIQSYELEQYDLICVVQVGKGGVAEPVLTGNLSGSVEVDWGKVLEVARTLYKPARAVARPVTDLPAAQQAQAPPAVPTGKAEPALSAVLPDLAQAAAADLTPADGDAPAPQQAVLTLGAGAAKATEPGEKVIATFERLKSLKFPGTGGVAKETAPTPAQAAPEAAQPQSLAPEAEPVAPEAVQPELIEYSPPETEPVAPEAAPSPAPEAEPAAPQEAAQPEPAESPVPEAAPAAPEAAQPELAPSPAPKPDVFDTPARYPEATELPQPDASAAPEQAPEAAPCEPEAKAAEPPTAGSLLALDICLAWPPLIEPLRSLFIGQPAEMPFDSPGYVFVRAPLPAETGLTHCMVGICCRNRRPRGVCYAIPSTFDIETPPGLEGYSWRGDCRAGYWVIWQDAESGEAICEDE